MAGESVVVRMASGHTDCGRARRRDRDDVVRRARIEEDNQALFAGRARLSISGA
jgi:hypothetical protein